jgi:HEAT repeat protein
MSAPTPTPTIRIRTAQELFGALRSPDLGMRMMVLRAIAANPDQTLAFGTFEGRDVIDALLDQAETARGYSDWLAVVGALAGFRDARVVPFFQHILATATEPQLIFVAAERLSREPAEALQAFLTPLLMQNESPARARAAADLLATCPDLSDGETLRVALLTSAEDARQAPPIHGQTAALWLAELEGAYRAEARDALEAQGEAAFLFLRERWDTLSEANRGWLLGWGARDWPHRIEELLAAGLEGGSEDVTLAALECLPALGADAAPRFSSSLARLARHPDVALRRAAIEAGADGVDWLAAIATETDPDLRRTCVRRLAQEEDEGALPTLIHLLQDADWEMGAAAAEALIGIGEPVLESVKPLVHHSNTAARTGAVQVLLALGQEAWLERELLAGDAASPVLARGDNG